MADKKSKGLVKKIGIVFGAGIILLNNFFSPISAEENCDFCEKEMQRAYLTINKHLNGGRYAFCKYKGNKYIDEGNDGELDFGYKLIYCDCSKEKIIYIAMKPGIEGWEEFKKDYEEVRKTLRVPFDIFDSDSSKAI